MLSEMFSSPLPNTMRVEIGAGFISTGPVGCSLWVFCLIFATLKILRLLFANGGKIISWEKEDALKGKILVKARVTELEEIPKSVRRSEGERFEEDS